MASFRCLLLPASLLLLFVLFLSIPPLFDLSQVTEAIPLASFFPITAMREGNKPMKAIFIKVSMKEEKLSLSVLLLLCVCVCVCVCFGFHNGFVEQKKKTSLRMIEASLAEARASIRNAVRWKNFTSEKKETYIPRGSIYRNPYAFHQLSFSY